MSNQRLRLLFCDHLNLARGKYLPAAKIGDGESRFCQGTFAVTYDKDLIPSPGSKMLEGLPDMVARYAAADIRDGWQPGTRVVVGDLYQNDGTPLPMCGRSLLKRTVAQWQEMGYTAKVGIELEAFAFQREPDGRLVPYQTPGAYVYGTGPLADPRGVVDAIWEQAEASGFRVECATSEYDAPQFEFTLGYDDALRAVDDIFLFRLMAREVALRHGILLTFMPKPILEKGGSGVHVNFSFSDAQGRNVIGERGGPEGMSELARGCVAGLMQHHASLAGLIAPSVNSYQRLQPASLSGYWRNWGGDHRGVTTRISAEGGTRARIEHRMGDGAANPYVLVAAVLQAARLGVVNAYPLAPMETGDCFEVIDAKDGVPSGLGEALDALAQDAALVEAIGSTLVQNHAFIKRDEIGKVGALEGEAARDYYLHFL